MTTPAAPVWAPWTSFYDPTGQGPNLTPQLAADGHAVSFELNDFLLSLPGQGTGEDAVLVAATALSGALSVGLPASYNLAGFLLVVRGNLEGSALTEAAVSCAIGHSTQSLSWPPPASPTGAWSGSRSGRDGAPTLATDFSLQCFTNDTSPGGAGESTSLPPIPITLSMQARRRTADELIIVQIESIDVVMLGLP
ncbi:MAG TPA: hypothetical protein VH089_06280 [Streptosporangiaceae bacterium]|jgi:hypothetical protein|nr:hypothetical protein [Streptosporangiaceae bacterium]